MMAAAASGRLIRVICFLPRLRFSRRLRNFSAIHIFKTGPGTKCKEVPQDKSSRKSLRCNTLGLTKVTGLSSAVTLDIDS